MASIGSLFVTLKLKGEDFQRGLSSARAGLTSLGKIAKVTGVAVAAMAATSGAAMIKITRDTARAGDEFQKMSLRVGVSVKTLSELAHAAELSGSNIQTVETGLRLMAKRALDADQGLKEAQRSFEELGISIKDSNGQLRAADALMMDAADKLAAMKDQTKATALAQELFGRSGTQLLPMLKAGSAGIAEMRKEAEKLGIVWSQKDADAAAELNDNISRLTAGFKGAEKTVGKTLIPIFNELVVAIMDEIIPSAQKFANKISDLITSFVNGAGGAKALAQSIRDVGFAAIDTASNLVSLISAASRFWAEWAHGSDNVLKRNQDNLRNIDEEIRAIDNRLGTAEFMNLGLNKKDQMVLAGRRAFLVKQREITNKTIATLKDEVRALKAASAEMWNAARISGHFDRKKRTETLPAVIKPAVIKPTVIKPTGGTKKEAANLNKITEDIVKDLKFTWDGYYEYRLNQINKEANEYYLKTGDDVLAEQWKTEQIKSLDEERADHTSKMANRSLKDWLQNGKAILNSEKNVQEHALQLWKSYEENTIAFRKNRLDESIELMQEAGISEVEIWEATKEEYIRIEEEKLEKSNNFMQGVRVGLLKLRQNITTWAQAGLSAVNWFSTNASQAMGQSLVAIVKGQWDELENIWDSFLNNMLNALVNTVTQMVIEWSVLKLFGVGGVGGYYYPMAGSMYSGGGGLFSNALTSYGAYYGASSLLGSAGLGASSLGSIGGALGIGGSTAALFAGSSAAASAGFSSAALGSIGSALGGSAALASLSWIPYVGWAAAAAALLSGQGGLGESIANGIGSIGESIGNFIGGIFDMGTPFVSNDMLAGVHKGERILSADHNERLVTAVEALVSGGSSGSVNIYGDIYSPEETLAKIDQGLRRRGLRRHG